MDIDILKEPPSKAEIENKSQALRKRLTICRVIGALVMVPTIFCLFKLLSSYGEIATPQTGIALLTFAIGLLVAAVLSLLILKYDSEEEDHQFATPDDCILLKTYLADPDIKAYRDKVVEQSRKFVQAEVEAMKEYYDGREKREACRAVYGVAEGES